MINIYENLSSFVDNKLNEYVLDYAYALVCTYPDGKIVLFKGLDSKDYDVNAFLQRYPEYSGAYILPNTAAAMTAVDNQDMDAVLELAHTAALQEDNKAGTRSNYGHTGPFWYYTKHGIGPGMLPDDVEVEQVMDDIPGDPWGTYIALDSVLSYDELKKYDMKEQMPPAELKIEENTMDVRHYTDMLYDMVDSDEVDAKEIAGSLMYWISEDNIKRFMEVNDLLFDEDEDEE